MYFVVRSYMINELGLNGNDLIMYAFLSSFTDGYKGSVKAIGKELNLDRSVASRIIGRLEADGFVKRTDGRIVCCKKSRKCCKKSHAYSSISFNNYSTTGSNNGSNLSLEKEKYIKERESRNQESFLLAVAGYKSPWS